MAISEDYSVASWWAVNENRNRATLIHSEFYKRNPSDRSVRHIDSVSEIADRLLTLKKAGLNPIIVYVDNTNDQSFGEIVRAKGFNVEEIHWSSQRKVDLMFHLRDCLSSGKIVIANDQRGDKLITQLSSYNFEISEFGNYKSNRDSNKKGNRKLWEDDFVSSCAMAASYIVDKPSIKPIAYSKTHKDKDKWEYLTLSKEDLAITI